MIKDSYNASHFSRENSNQMDLVPADSTAQVDRNAQDVCSLSPSDSLIFKSDLDRAGLYMEDIFKKTILPSGKLEEYAA